MGKKILTHTNLIHTFTHAHAYAQIHLDEAENWRGERAEARGRGLERRN